MEAKKTGNDVQGTHARVAINMGDHLVPTTRKLRYQHQFTYHVPITTVDYIKFSFCLRTAADWNRLPSHIVTASTLDIYQSRLGSAYMVGLPSKLDNASF